MRTAILDLFNENEFLKICAPMVRYSKVQFRSLARRYGCDLCYTPMILADSFCKSQKARSNEFMTNEEDTPLVVQFAAKTVHDFVGATYMVVPYSDGVELNCGCPQRWAIRDGYGCALLHQPELLSDLIKRCRAHVPQTYTISAKIRLLSNIRKTVEFCRCLEKAGISFITIHGRTPSQRSEPVNSDAIKTIKESLTIPVVANGDVKTLDDADALKNVTGCNGVMAARGMLTNPAMFKGHTVTPWECVKDWVNICYNSTREESEIDVTNCEKNNGSDDILVLSNAFNPMAHNNDMNSFKINEYVFPERHSSLTFQCFHHHLVFMLEKLLTKSQRQIFNNLNSFSSVMNYLSENFNITPTGFSEEKYMKNKMINVNYDETTSLYAQLLSESLEIIDENNESVKIYDANLKNGVYFDTKLKESDENDDILMKSMFG